MADIFILKSVFIFISIWGLTIILLWFRPRIEIFWKIIATLIYGCYIGIFFDEIVKGFGIFKSDWFVSILNFSKELISLVSINLFFIWPLCLVIIFYKADDVAAEKLLKFISILTLVLWILFVIYSYFSTGIDKFLYENLKKMIPHGN